MTKNLWRKVLLSGLALSFLWSGEVFSALNQITDCRVQIRESDTRLVFDATAPIHYHLFSLENPNRLVIDVDNASLVRLFPRSLFAGTSIKDMRTSSNKNNTLRMVFDLRGKVKSNSFTLNPSGKKGYRLVIDIAPSYPKMVAAPVNVQKTKSRPRYISHYQSSYQKGPNVAHTANTKPSKPKPVSQKTASTGATQTAKRPSDVIIVIDPGHGGKDPGATGARGTREKTVVLEIAKILQHDINAQPGFRAYLTRKSDYYLTLRQRLAIARRDKGDMFIAIHADAFHDHKARGASVYALSSRGVTSEAARWLASKENESELMGGVDLTDKSNLLKSVLINLSQTATIRASLNIGQRIIHALSHVGHLHHHEVEQAAFVVLKSPDIPSLLVETGFLSNREEERQLRSPAYRAQLAKAIMQGIRSYFINSPPRDTWLADQKFNTKKTNRRYTVSRGDTLSGIAIKFNTSTAKLMKVNHLRTPNIKIGAVLSIPS